MSKLAMITFSRAGFHNWPNATGERDYLGNRHRHLFQFRVEVTVHHNEREIEFHDLRDVVAGLYAEPVEFGAQSCETIAESVVDFLTKKYGAGRAYAVEVWEDGEVGARVERQPTL